MAGLVSRVVWIWPRWDADRASKSAGYELQTVELGWFSADEAHGGFCRCDVVPLDRGTGMSLRRCAYNNETADDDNDDEESALSPERCHVRATYTQESVRADRVLERLTASSPRWLETDDVGGVIVDVDEDFFGVESPADRLRGAWRAVRRVDAALSLLLCPRTGADEAAADRLSRRLVRAVLCRRGVGGCRPSALDATAPTSAFVRRPALFCRTTAAGVRAAWATAAAVLARTRPAHLRRILAVGFCLSAAPRTHRFGRDRHRGDLAVCAGANDPNSTLVYRHTPSDVELDVQLARFERLVAALLRRATAAAGARRRLLVTVSRSVRDGYTPRSLAGRIEDGVLTALRRQRRAGAMTVVYDSDLLGGRDGWTTGTPKTATKRPQSDTKTTFT